MVIYIGNVAIVHCTHTKISHLGIIVLGRWQGSRPLVPMPWLVARCLSGQNSSLQAAPEISTVVYRLRVMVWKMASLVAVKDSNNPAIVGVSTEEDSALLSHVLLWFSLFFHLKSLVLHKRFMRKVHHVTKEMSLTSDAVNRSPSKLVDSQSFTVWKS